MHSSIAIFCLLCAGAFALPSHLESKRQQAFSYNGSLGTAEACPSPSNPSGIEAVASGHSFVSTGAPPNYPNYNCIPWSSTIDWVSINLFLSNSTALMAFSDVGCQDRVSFIEAPGGLGEGDGFCASQTKNGGSGSWKAVMYTEP